MSIINSTAIQYLDANFLSQSIRGENTVGSISLIK